MNIDLAKDLLMPQENKRSSLNNIARIFPRLSCTVLAPQLMLIPTAHAVEILPPKKSASHCVLLTANPEGVDDQYCVRYIQGFSDGAVAADAQVMLNAENAIAGDGTFAERAIRTRIPGRVNRSRAAKLADFRLGEPAMEVVYKSLMTNCSCIQ
jgi:hypothetical protein